MPGAKKLNTDASHGCWSARPTWQPGQNGRVLTVVVQKLDDNGDPEGSPKTVVVDEQDPAWCVKGLTLGTYEVTTFFEAGQRSLPRAAACSATYTVTLTEELFSVQDVAFGFECRGEILGSVFCDLNGNGEFDPDLGECRTETHFIPVMLTGAAVRNTQTDTFCNYAFTGLDAGVYTVSVEAADFTARGFLPPAITSVTLSVPAAGPGECD